MVLTLSAIGIQRKKRLIWFQIDLGDSEKSMAFEQNTQKTAHHFSCEEPSDNPKLRRILQKITVLYSLGVPIT